MLRNPFETKEFENGQSDFKSSRVTASGFTETAVEHGMEESVLDLHDPSVEHPVIKLQGPTPPGFTIGLHSWKDSDGMYYTKEVLIKEDRRSEIGPNAFEKHFSFTPGDDLSKTARSYISKKGENKHRIYGRRRDSAFDESDNDDTIQPNDSISRVPPNAGGSRIAPLSYNKNVKFEEQSIPVGLNERFEQSVAISNQGSCFYNDVIGGYGQSADEKIDELDAISKIQKITGLPQIFVNARLNFLIHLHKPLQEIMSKGGEYPCEDSLWKLSEFIRKYKTSRRDPHKDLLYQVITTSIRNDKVRANPFCLPLLEVGMYLNDKLIYISFSQLYQEYQIEWFRSMKDIEPPRFHSAYKSFTSTKYDRNNSRPEERRRKKSGSVISSLGF